MIVGKGTKNKNTNAYSLVGTLSTATLIAITLQCTISVTSGQNTLYKNFNTVIEHIVHHVIGRLSLVLQIRQTLGLNTIFITNIIKIILVID